jgi:aspartyl-tRNA synthetase
MVRGGVISEMSFGPYRAVLAQPGVRRLLLGGFLARVPYAAMGLSLTLFVRFGLDQGYFEAGLVGAAFVIGAAIGSTVHGRVADRAGIRPVLALTSVAMGAFWLTVPLMPYPVLLGLALFAGVLNLPVFIVVRQPLAAMIPEAQRRTAYALDSTLVEITFMIGPALATVMSAAAAPQIMPIAIGLWAPLAGAFLWWVNPRTRAEHETTDAVRPPRRQWLTGPMIAMLIAGVGATVTLGGSDVAIVSTLESHSEMGQAWAVMAVWALYSLLGGFAFGTTDRHVNPLVLLAVMGAATIPLGLLGNWWLLAGLVTAPSIAASVDRVSKLAPPSVRGEAMGMHGSAITLGSAIGAPLVGLAVDHIGAPWGFVAAGAGSLVATGGAALLARTRDRGDTPAEPRPAAATA